MAGRSNHRRGRRTGIVWGLVLLVCAFFVLSTVQDKYGYDFGLPQIKVPSVSALLGLDELPDGQDSMSPATVTTRDGLEVHMLDMGQANSALILAPEKTVLIDAGDVGQGKHVLKYLREEGVTRIDILIGTHPHSDHIGGMSDVIGDMEIGQVILPDIPDAIFPTTATFGGLLQAIDDKGLGITPAVPGDCYDLGGGATLTILGPLREYNNLNDQSAVSHVVYRQTSFLFMGDAEKAVEKDLLEQHFSLRSNALMVGHHGSNTSSTKAFLQAVYPQIALISCGLDNNYGHPHREVIERLQELDAHILRTDRDGAVVLVSDGESIGIKTGGNT